MIDRVHQHFVSELRQGTRTDTIFVVIAVLLNLLMLAISSGMDRPRTERRRPCSDRSSRWRFVFLPLET